MTSPAQPDWYIGWVEGALRMYPPWEFRVFGRLVPNPFVPAVLVPAATFLLLYLWPFLEQRLTRDPAAHQLLDRPHDHPVRCAAGVGTLTFYGLLVVTASNDVVAKLAGVPVGGHTWAGRILLLVPPPVAAATAYVLARALQDSGVGNRGVAGAQPAVALALPRAIRRRSAACLPEHKEYESREVALRSATTSYPDVAVLQRESAAAGHRPVRDRLLLLALLTVAVLLLWPRRRCMRQR